MASGTLSVDDHGRLTGLSLDSAVSQGDFAVLARSLGALAASSGYRRWDPSEGDAALSLALVPDDTGAARAYILRVRGEGQRSELVVKVAGDRLQPLYICHRDDDRRWHSDLCTGAQDA